MHTPDPDKERSQKVLSVQEFLSSYNQTLPTAFPRVSLPLLGEFKKAHPSLFTHTEGWTLDQHRKKVMDWLTLRRE